MAPFFSVVAEQGIKQLVTRWPLIRVPAHDALAEVLPFEFAEHGTAARAALFVVAALLRKPTGQRSRRALTQQCHRRADSRRSSRVRAPPSRRPPRPRTRGTEA